MFVSECLNVNNKGHLTIGGCDTLELAKEFGTPLYVLDETTIRNVCKAYVKSFEKYYHGNGMPLYASKALSCKAVRFIQPYRQAFRWKKFTSTETIKLLMKSDLHLNLM